MVVVDTHAAVWWAGESKRLGSGARRCLAEADCVGVPVIVFWEVSLLVRRKKLALGMSVREWANALCSIPRVEEIPLDMEIALRADALEMHPDPADRFIVASALVRDARLITKDRKIRSLRFVECAW